MIVLMINKKKRQSHTDQNSTKRIEGQWMYKRRPPLAGYGGLLKDVVVVCNGQKNSSSCPAATTFADQQRAARLALAGALAFGGERQTSAAIGRLWIDLHVE
ncbi:hypothetical protein T11_3408 [Trichinella zimbabwensis]|uniref:Uncharacterized protein n=1 Tax=Trichinella zimbabwensis TaxID=268475 RepID=A0A0V1HQR3_9BILA|nr:hypothetical protein T11_3408 [Trichinella zimbabwensis]